MTESQPGAGRSDELVSQLTLDEKAALVAGADTWRTPAIERLGIGAIKTSDGPNGARGEHFTGGPPSACFPCGTALAASWDPDLVERVGAAIGEEARAKGAHVLLGPTVNLHRSPLAGRNFECYSEDPYLSARMAAAYVTGVQSRGVAACVKHFVCNDSEFERFTISAEVDHRTLREVYLAPFEAALLGAGAWSVMAAYNRLHGVFCSESAELLTSILRDDWHWDGAVVSDWGATHSTAPALAAGLDLEMPGPPRMRGAALAETVRAGDLDASLVDRAVLRLLRLAERTGALEAGGGGASGEAGSGDQPERRALLREAAAAGIVLLRNEAVAGRAPVLPLDPSSIGSLAVIGPNAELLHAQGGGSAYVSPPLVVSPREGISARAGSSVAIRDALGCVPSGRALDVSRVEGRGLLVEYFDGPAPVGAPLLTQLARRSTVTWPGDFTLARGSSWCARISGTYRPRVSGEHVLTVRGGEADVRLFVDDRLVAGADEPAAVVMRDDRSYSLRVEYVPAAGTPILRGLDVRCVQPSPEDLLDRAVGAARDSDIAVVVVGLDSDWEREGRDRRRYELPPGQDDLVQRVAAANPRTVVVVNAGSAVAMDWADSVAAIVQLWCPGQEGGAALADVLFGDVDPGGRLPTTFPSRLEDAPSAPYYPGSGGRVHYGEGVFVGYRGYERSGTVPRFAFGHGLSYTTFDYGSLRVEPRRLRAGDTVEASLELTNTGTRPGVEVVQLYVRDVEARVPRPEQELRGFAKVDLEPGATETVRFTLEPRAFAFWDGGWCVEPGEFELRAGPSSAEPRARARARLHLDA